MAFVTTPLQLTGNNVVQNIVYLTQDVTNPCINVDDVALQQPIIFSYPHINTLPCVEDVSQTQNNLLDYTFCENYNTVEGNDLTSNTNLLIDNLQQPVIINFPSINTLPASNKDTLTPLDFISKTNYNTGYQILNRNTTVNCLPQSTPFSNDIPPLQYFTNDESSAQQNVDDIISYPLEPNYSDNNNVGNVQNTNNTEVSIDPNIDNSNENLSIWPGRPKKDGTQNLKNKRRKKCDYCDKKYLTQNMIKKHIELKHPEVKDTHVCSKCSKKFNSTEKIILHEIDHWTPNEKCPLATVKSCGKFSSKTALRAHIYRCHLSFINEQPYPCHLCKKAFDKPSQLIRHHRVHTGEKPFKCDFCGFAFGQKNSLVQHLRIHLKNYPYKCSLCPQKFKQSGNLRTHIRTIHLKIKNDKEKTNNKSSTATTQKKRSYPKNRKKSKKKDASPKTACESAPQGINLEAKVTDTSTVPKYNITVQLPQSQTNNELRDNESVIVTNTLPENDASDKINYYITVDDVSQPVTNSEQNYKDIQSLLASHITETDMAICNSIDFNNKLPYSGNYFIPMSENSSSHIVLDNGQFNENQFDKVLFIYKS